jgi:FolB domain-containing protein
MTEPLDGDARIHIHQLEVMTRIGVPDEERATAQRLTFNLTLWPSRPFGDLDDDIDRAVNYAAVCVEAKKFVETRSDRLIETLADVLAQHLLGVFALRRITIELRKYILPEVEFVSVQITRERAAG